MDSSYVQLSVLKQRLLAGLYTTETLPTDQDLEFIIALAEARFEEWLGRRLPPTNYLDRYKTDVRGICLLRQFPVIAVHKITMVPVEQFGYVASPLTLGPFLGHWHGGRKLSTGRPGVTIEVSYIAGLDPVPNIIYATFFQLLLSILTKSGTTGDLSFLDEPQRDVASISLPGGLTKTYKTASVGALAGQGPAVSGSQLDRLLGPVARYRLAYLT